MCFLQGGPSRLHHAQYSMQLYASGEGLAAAEVVLCAWRAVHATFLGVYPTVSTPWSCESIKCCRVCGLWAVKPTRLSKKAKVLAVLADMPGACNHQWPEQHNATVLCDAPSSHAVRQRRHNLPTQHVLSWPSLRHAPTAAHTDTHTHTHIHTRGAHTHDLTLDDSALLAAVAARAYPAQP